MCRSAIKLAHCCSDKYSLPIFVNKRKDNNSCLPEKQCIKHLVTISKSHSVA